MIKTGITNNFMPAETLIRGGMDEVERLNGTKIYKYSV